MPIIDSFLPEFDQESKVTRKVIERVPSDKLDFQPHPKSMTAGRLATHLAELMNWCTTTIQTAEFDVAQPWDSAKLTSTEEILTLYDRNAAEARKALAGVSDQDMMAMWSLKAGDQMIFSMPRSATLRSFVFNHLVHHRAQLGVYLRLMDVPVPQTYGPSADEGGM